LIGLAQVFKPVVKDRLYYDQFEYGIRFNLEEVSCLRTLDHAHIDRMIERRMPSTLLISGSNTISYETIDRLHALADVLLNTSAKFKLVVSMMSTGYFYTNEPTLIAQLAKLPGISNIEYNQAVIGRPRNTVILKNPQYRLRSYFKMNLLTTEQKNHLSNFLANQPTVRTSPALKEWLFIKKRLYTQCHFFIDHNDTSWLTMLSLVQPGLIKKTLQILPTK
jgi:hypothetical protein